MLVNEQDVVLEACVEMWLKSQVDDDRVMVAVDMGIDTVETLEDLADCLTEALGERDTCSGMRIRTNLNVGWSKV